MLRTLTINGNEYQVDRGVIVSPGKFEGEEPHVVRDYNASLEGTDVESFGDSENMGYYYAVAKGDEWSLDERNAHKFRYYVNDSQGFVLEITYRSFVAAREEYEYFWGA